MKQLIINFFVGAACILLLILFGWIIELLFGILAPVILFFVFLFIMFSIALGNMIRSEIKEMRNKKND